jgi:hypothetical protein
VTAYPHSPCETLRACLPETIAQIRNVLDEPHLSELPWALRTGIDETAALILQEFLDGVSKKALGLRQNRWITFRPRPRNL